MRKLRLVIAVLPIIGFIGFVSPWVSAALSSVAQPPPRATRPESAVVQEGRSTARAETIVEGSIVLGARPGAGLRLSWRPAKGGKSSEGVMTDVGGRFVFSVGEPGEYFLNLRSLPYFTTAIRRAVFGKGRNQVTVTVPDTRLDLEVLRVDGKPAAEPVQLHILRDEMQVIREVYAGILLPSDGHRVSLVGLDPGRYRVTADAVSGLVAAGTARADLREGVPAAARLVMRDLAGTIELRDASGRLVRGGQVLHGPTALAGTGPGVFSLHRVPVGSVLQIDAPGYLPSCRIRTDLSDMVVTLARGASPVAIRMFGTAGSAMLGYVVGLPGSDCGVPLAALAPKPSRQGDALVGETVALPAGRYEYRFPEGPGSQPFVVPGGRLDLTMPSLTPCGGPLLPVRTVQKNGGRVLSAEGQDAA